MFNLLLTDDIKNRVLFIEVGPSLGTWESSPSTATRDAQAIDAASPRVSRWLFVLGTVLTIYCLMGLYAQTAENSVQPLGNGFLGKNWLIFAGSGTGVKI